MSVNEVLQKLESMGTAQNRKVYRRHGANAELFGVSFANLHQLNREIKRDHELAEGLFDSGNLDAMTLATMIADPEVVSEAQLDDWAGRMSYYPLVDSFVKHLAARLPEAGRKADQWSKSRDEWVGRAGWQLVAVLAGQPGSVSPGRARELIAAIEQGIHQAKNRKREAMNNALISLGAMGGELETRAIDAARVIGKVEIDHGETGCKTPDAEAYILKIKARNAKRSKQE